MTRRFATAAGILLLGIATTGCAMFADDDNDRDHGDHAQKAAKRTAVATVKPGSGSNVAGTVTFTADGDSGPVRMVAEITGLSPGEHGFHIHEKGDLSAADLSSAGGHFNPAGHKHGGPDDKEKHAGDLGNITADANGKARKVATVEGISIGTGKPNDIIGRSVIVHAKADDLKTQPSGDAGGRVGGGVIQMQPKKSDSSKK